jgi:FKBP-type peptidyl-prolyl cis-trans isomerase SlyD
LFLFKGYLWHTVATAGCLARPTFNKKNKNYTTMQISKEKVVSIHYTLRDNTGNILDSSEGHDPLLYIQGIGNLIPGMEEGLEGKAKGDKLEIKVSPERGYGVRDDKMIQKVPRSAFGGQEVKKGMQFQAGTNHGTQVVTVTEVGLDSITVDGNHPLAGVELNFSVEVLEVRNATAEELAHGHVHGPGGHHH